MIIDSKTLLLEICTENAEAARLAELAGADRIELCANLAQGGITPSLGMIMQTVKAVSIPIQVMIRPRAGDFCYTDTEFEVMRADILQVKKTGASGIVLGILSPDGAVDIGRTRELVALARPLSCTFHRAFDLTADPVQALEDVISTGADRLLTSGQQPNACLGKKLITALIKQAKDRIIIMPGAGINAMNIKEILTDAKAMEVHMTAHKYVPGRMAFHREGLAFSNTQNTSEYDVSVFDVDKIQKIKDLEKL